MPHFALLVFLLFSHLYSFTQPVTDANIQVRAEASVVSGEFFIDIDMNVTETKIVFRLKDSLDRRLYLDKEWIKYGKKIKRSLKAFGPDNDKFRSYIYKSDSMKINYTRYSIDSITISNDDNRQYIESIQKLITTSKDSLENTNRTVLDGVWMTWQIRSKERKEKIYAHSPDAKSHPILFSFITETTGLYREMKKNDFLKSRRTFGY